MHKYLYIRQNSNIISQNKWIYKLKYMLKNNFSKAIIKKLFINKVSTYIKLIMHVGS